MENGNHFICFKTAGKRETVEYFYLLEDENWHKNVHKRAGTPIENINDTLSSIADESVMYVVKNGEELCGYFVRYEDKSNLVLEGFHIAKKYRVGMFFNLFWSFVKSKFEREFLIGIYYKNKDAIRHLSRQGFEYLKTIVYDNKEYYILTYKK